MVVAWNDMGSRFLLCGEVIVASDDTLPQKYLPAMSIRSQISPSDWPSRLVDNSIVHEALVAFMLNLLRKGVPVERTGSRCRKA